MDPTTEIHAVLPDTLVTGLDRIARERGIRRVHVIREAVAEYLVRSEADRIEREMQAYVEAMAEYSTEFTDETDAHTVERLLRETEW